MSENPNGVVRANVILFVLLVAHTVDHGVNQPARHVPGVLGLIGLTGFIVVAGSLLLALRRSPHAPSAAVLVGSLTALSFIAIHLLPSWGPVSDPYWDFEPNIISWVLVLAPILAALLLAARGLQELSGTRTARAA